MVTPPFRKYINTGAQKCQTESYQRKQKELDKVIIVDYYVHKENKHENIVNNTRNNILSQSPATEGGEGESEI